MIPRIFEDRTVAIVASGPSLGGVDWSGFDGLPIIAINRRHEDLPGAAVLWWSDALYWRRAQESLLAHPAPWKATGHIGYQPGELPHEIEVYRFTGKDGFDPDPEHLRTGNNSAFAAMHLAVHLGASGLVLFGVDMRHGPSGETHCDGGHGFVHREETLRDLMVPFFKSIAPHLAAQHVAVLNASPESALTIWPRCSIDEGLKACARPRSSSPSLRNIPGDRSGPGLSA